MHSLVKPVQITAKTVAEFHYTLTNTNNEVIDSSRDREPMRYLHGANTIVSGLEQEMEGKKPGDKFQVEVTPENGYGERVDQLVQNVPRSAFEGIDEVAPGMRFRAETQNGPVTVTVTEVGDEEVTVDGNHPLAGETLNFDVEVVDVREASEDEVEHGHPHDENGEHEEH
ncbi:FKBP-type peptidyl-prolyl cis-trans isomerase [Algiphilus aromaticivorans]|jgi:FKBP-type peptidyl-prolyl cis-trans isomerase SlyD|uniref:FKBP-type peptidyl-prolyl cis-trans isomerase n=1 Tax=Algiphilus aromaticivorans TaxID=382454 RepID=UPI000694C1CD